MIILLYKIICKMKGKTVLITGATSGIGKATALSLARQGATVILHGRNPQKTEAVRQEISGASGNPNIDILIADLFLLEEVKKMVQGFKKKYDHLDVLINNAGSLMGRQRETTPEGHEKTIALNVLSPFLLTALLFSQLKKSADARIINVSSSAHKQSARPDFKDIESRQHYSPLQAYGNAKLFTILLTQHLAARLKDSHITTNTMHPGAVASNFSVDSDLGGALKFIGKIARLFFRTSEQGADTLVYLASSGTVKGITGKYFIDRQPASVGRKYNTPDNEKIIWDYCIKNTGIDIPDFLLPL
jgi:NAD(P)-dependent dehydrogenase (short-subunit alcohol dehydrogenase family)